MIGESQYRGKTGHLFAANQFLMHGWNAAIPEVDVGDDIYVVKDVKGYFRRVQVKTSTAVERGYGCSVQFKLPRVQLRKTHNPELVYFLVVRRNLDWYDYLIIKRSTIKSLIFSSGVGRKYKDCVNLYIKYDDNNGSIICSSRDFSKFSKDWTHFDGAKKIF